MDAILIPSACGQAAAARAARQPLLLDTFTLDERQVPIAKLAVRVSEIILSRVIHKLINK
jgi:hypothetical protein